MSQPDEKQPVVRLQRRVQPPAHLTDCELGEPLVHRQPHPAFSQSRVHSPSSAGPTQSTSPVSQESEQEKCILRNEWRLPFTYTMRALTKMYSQPHQLALQRIADLMDGLNIRSGDVKAFCLFGLHVRSLVSMLEQLGQKGTTELECGSHVSRLISKLPHDLRYSFKWYTYRLGITIPTLLDFSKWLEYKLQVQGDHTDYTPQSKQVSSEQRKEIRRDSKQTCRPTAIILGTEKSKATSELPADQQKPVTAKGERMNAYCPYCDSNRHLLNNCENFKLLAKEQRVTWIKTKIDAGAVDMVIRQPTAF